MNRNHDLHNQVHLCSFPLLYIYDKYSGIYLSRLCVCVCVCMWCVIVEDDVCFNY